MVGKPTVGLVVPLVAKADKGTDLSNFLVAGKALVDQEPKTIQWYGFKISDTEHVIIDTFEDDSGRDAHLSGAVAQALGQHAPVLLAGGPEISPVSILASLVRPESKTTEAKVGIYVPLVAKPEKAQAVKEFLISALPLVEKETLTLQWYAYQKSETEFGIFDTAAAEEGRQAHLNGEVAALLLKHADELLAQPPSINLVDILAIKVVV
ncbi:hypothetical protein M422DRAFT_775868 [Sphaerobolus stellatus SS14]|nr:hypothetical protein M422DRAFT_775868 [Sphaerobolus stellatus SS14]